MRFCRSLSDFANNSLRGTFATLPIALIVLGSMLLLVAACCVRRSRSGGVTKKAQPMAAAADHDKEEDEEDWDAEAGEVVPVTNVAI